MANQKSISPGLSQISPGLTNFDNFLDLIYKVDEFNQ